MRRTISCVMIVLNEESNVRKALESVQMDGPESLLSMRIVMIGQLQDMSRIYPLRFFYESGQVRQIREIMLFSMRLVIGCSI